MSTVTKTSTTSIAASPEDVWNEIGGNFLGIYKWAGGVKSDRKSVV